MKKLFVLLASFALCAALSGCTVFEMDPEALMHPPVFTEEQEKLNAALSEVIGEVYTLKYPKNGDINSAFVFYDLDEDGTEEALAFYSLLDDSTRINILKKENNEWTSVYEAAGFYGDIEKIDFAKIDGGGDALVVKWEKEAAIYRYSRERLETVYSTSCDGTDIADINGDGYMDIILFSSSISGKGFVNLVYSDGERTFVSEELSINASYSGIYSLSSGLLCNGKPAYFIDSSVYEGVYLTEMISFADEDFERTYIADYVESEGSDIVEEVESSGVIVITRGDYGKRGIFLRNTKVYCMDINGDGITEMPVEVREDYAQDATDDIFYLQYVQYNGTESFPVWNGIANTENGYLFTVPEEWNKTVNVSFGSTADELIFSDASTGEEILYIRAVLKSDYQDKYEDLFLAASDETKNYYVKSNTDPESGYYIPYDILKISFIFI